MRTMTFALLIAGAVALALPARAQEELTTSDLLREMSALGRLASWPEPAFRTIQYSSYDRRSKNPELPGWFENSDGFGGEPIPGFEAVLRAADDQGVGEYLVVDQAGPGAIVRGWSAGMDGVLRVYLDGEHEPLYEGTGYEFLARRSQHFFKSAGISGEFGDAFIQQDADYLPVPFAKRLRVTWEGRLDELHFYHLQVRFYDSWVLVRSFDPERDLRGQEQLLGEVADALTQPRNSYAGAARDLSSELAAFEKVTHPLTAPKGGGAITELVLQVSAEQLNQALRGIALRIYCDDSALPQVECPAGDFFGTGPGINPYSSLPISVDPNGRMVSRWVMPFAEGAQLQFENCTDQPVKLACQVTLSPWDWNERSLYFRLKWRVQHNLLGGPQELVRDLPFLRARGRGQLVGLASILMNPTGIPTPWGSWWGEGDEKIFVDDSDTPAAFGTGSEDYYNYSWSRPDLFDHPYCGQPLDSGPGNSGYVSNHRWQIMDAIPFERALEASLELYPHTKVPGMSYACLAYHYARPGCRDDHRALTPAELIVPPLPEREAALSHGSRNSKIFYFDELPTELSSGTLEPLRVPLAMRGRVLGWPAQQGQRLSVTFPVETEGYYKPNLVLLHRPDGAVILLKVDGRQLLGLQGEELIALRTAHQTRDLNVYVQEVLLEAGDHTLEIECLEEGFIGLDYLWVQRTKDAP